MSSTLIQLSLIAILLLSAAPSHGIAQEPMCADCHSCCRCERVCRLVREEKKVSITCWGCKCEDVCLPGCSERGCLHREEVFNGVDPEVCSTPKCFSWYDWIPGCPKEFVTKKKLMRKTVTKMVPSFKWVVEDICPTCRDKYVPPEVPAGEKVPQPPRVKATVLK